ncbi:hypothetical protein HKD37_06G017706 [Glycine soja]|uniref:Uncharacterized protein n=1 Tax=Glycine max TaxID=3847 RepID=A0A0R0JP74_SOYBN|nr:hypothetical protein GYH30_016899 [Glycine max]
MKFKAAEIETHNSGALISCWEGNLLMLFDSCAEDKTNNEGVQTEKGSCVEGQGWPTKRAGFSKVKSNKQ